MTLIGWIFYQLAPSTGLSTTRYGSEGGDKTWIPLQTMRFHDANRHINTASSSVAFPLSDISTRAPHSVQTETWWQILWPGEHNVKEWNRKFCSCSFGWVSDRHPSVPRCTSSTPARIVAANFLVIPESDPPLHQWGMQIYLYFAWFKCLEIVSNFLFHHLIEVQTALNQNIATT